MNKNVVVFDIDGVLADFEGKLVDALVNEFGGLGSLNRHKFNMGERFKDHPKILRRAEQYINDPNFYYGIEPNYHACNLVADFMEDGYGVMYVTSRPKSHETFTRRWLQKNTPDYSKSLGLFCGVSDKADFLKDVSVEFLIDDNPAEITRCKKNSIPVLCWWQAWNSECFPRLFVASEVDDRVLMVQANESTESVPFWSVFTG